MVSLLGCSHPLENVQCETPLAVHIWSVFTYFSEHKTHTTAKCARVVPSVTPPRPRLPISTICSLKTYCNESCRICLRARTYMALAISPTTNTSPSAQAAAPNKAGPCDGALAGESDCFRGGNTPAPDIRLGEGKIVINGKIGSLKCCEFSCIFKTYSIERIKIKLGQSTGFAKCIYEPLQTNFKTIEFGYGREASIKSHFRLSRSEKRFSEQPSHSL